ncbi:glycosyltransferase [Aquirufa sp. ROCK-SH2]
MKKIIYTGSFRFPAVDASSERVLNNARILSELGYEVIFYSFGGPVLSQNLEDSDFGYYQGFKYVVTNDLDIVERNLFSRIINFLIRGTNAFKLIFSSSIKPDIIITYNPSFYFSLRILKFCRKRKIQLISDLTEWYDPNEFLGGKYGLPYLLYGINMKIIQKLVRNKIVISSFLDSYYRNSNNIILPPLLDPADEKWSIKEQVLPTFDGVRIIYAGTPTKKDLLETIIDAVILCLEKGLKLQFVIVGVSLSETSKYVNYNKIQLYPNHICFCGRVPQKLVPAYYNASNFSIFLRIPNRKNTAGFPTKLVESMMAGCPVILNYTSDIGEYVIDEYNGFVVSDFSTDSLFLVLEKICNISVREMDILKSNSLKCANENFSFKQHISRMDSFIQNIY